jgi:acetyltransferase-like isoleucine patch superfamily enzyme
MNETQWVKLSGGYARSSVRVYSGGGLKVGDLSWISDDCYIDAQGGIEIGNQVIIGPHTNIYSSEHGILPNEPIREQHHVKKSTKIGDDVWIGANCVILGGVTISDHVIIGAGAIVTHNVPEWEIWAGNPAKKIGDRRTWKQKV